MRWKFSRDVDCAAVWCIDPYPPRMQMELAADPAGQERLGPAIFRIADDRMPDRGHMRAQLVRSPGQRLKLEPCRAVAGPVDEPPAGLRRKPMLLADMHLLPARA